MTDSMVVSTKNLQAALRLRLLLLYTAMLHLAMSASSLTLGLLFHICGSDVCNRLLYRDWVTSNVFACHISCGVEIIVPIRKADESVAFGFRGPLVANDARFLDGRVLREGLEEGVVGRLAREIADEDAEMGRVPF